jgi:hypothetical protein
MLQCLLCFNFLEQASKCVAAKVSYDKLDLKNILNFIFINYIITYFQIIIQFSSNTFSNLQYQLDIICFQMKHPVLACNVCVSRILKISLSNK